MGALGRGVMAAREVVCGGLLLVGSPGGVCGEGVVELAERRPGTEGGLGVEGTLLSG